MTTRTKQSRNTRSRSDLEQGTLPLRYKSRQLSKAKLNQHEVKKWYIQLPKKDEACFRDKIPQKNPFNETKIAVLNITVSIKDSDEPRSDMMQEDDGDDGIEEGTSIRHRFVIPHFHQPLGSGGSIRATADVYRQVGIDRNGDQKYEVSAGNFVSTATSDGIIVYVTRDLLENPADQINENNPVESYYLPWKAMRTPAWISPWRSQYTDLVTSVNRCYADKYAALDVFQKADHPERLGKPYQDRLAALLCINLASGLQKHSQPLTPEPLPEQILPPDFRCINLTVRPI